MPTLRALNMLSLHKKQDLGPKSSGHDVDFGTFTFEGTSFTSWITKLNKHKGRAGQEASVLEVAFSETALMFIKPGLTPPARIVTEGDVVVGVASENFNVQIKKQMDKGETCYSFNPQSWSFTNIPKVLNPSSRLLALQREKLEKRAPGERLIDDAVAESLQLEENKKAVNFLDKMPKDFFVALMKKHNEGDVVVDMESLASILTASYVLEEDDLHKGNIGFYITDAKNEKGELIRDKDGKTKKQFTFFKIDHDLMFIDSIMSQKDMRLANILYNKDSFKITVKDLENFPDLKDSGNHYWPTRERTLSKGDKAYKSEAERNAFANLKKDEAFCNAKWKYLLKSAIMPTELIEKSLSSQLDKATEIDKFNMVENALCTRVAQLKDKLVQSEKFREYMGKHGEDAFKAIKSEIEGYINTLGLNEDQRKQLMDQLKENFDRVSGCCQFYKDQSPIYRSILLGSYDFSSKTKTTETHIVLALEQFSEINDPTSAKRFTAACIAIDVINKFGEANVYQTELDELERAKNSYINPKEEDTKEVKKYQNFLEMADKIRASSLPLKQQTKEMFAMLHKVKLPIDVLRELKEELQRKEPSSPSLKFIKQLQNDPWFVRKFSGTYGKTSAASTILDEINSQIEKACIESTQRYREESRKLVDPQEFPLKHFGWLKKGGMV